jgi:hypothetical protein
MISIDEFVRIAGVKESTIRKNKDKIPGLSYNKGTYSIIDGTRYPCDLHRYKISNSADKRYLLLKAISEYKYISHLDLGLYHPQFVEMIKELLDAGLIQPNNMDNCYGANFYDCTREGDELLRQQKNSAINKISNLIVAAAGKFVGNVISEVAA